MPSFSHKFFRNLLTAGLLGGLWLAAVPVSIARINETQPQLEKHLFSDNTAMRIPAPISSLSQVDMRHRTIRAGAGPVKSNDGFDMSKIEGLFWFASGQQVPLPNADGSQPSPPDFQELIYFKTDDGTPAKDKLQDPTKATGWELHVYLYKQVSVLEIYRRVGPRVQDAEINALLDANRGASSWTHDTENATGDDVPTATDDATLSYIGYSAQRADKEVATSQTGNDVVFFSISLDKRLLELRRQQIKATAARAPVVSPNSVKGF